VLRFGGVAALVAAYMTSRIEEQGGGGGGRGMGKSVRDEESGDGEV